jgi:3-oxoadipate enol-lactonase
MRNANIACLVLVLTATGVARGKTSSPSNAPGAFVEVDGGRLYYEECGGGDEAVVLLHDGVANSAVWDDVWPALYKRFHAIRYDRRGYGRSPATDIVTQGCCCRELAKVA